MKILLLFVSLIICALSQNTLHAQQYHPDDKEGLRQFLRQTSAELGKLNLEQLGLSISDTLNWNTSEEWIKKIGGIEWINTDSLLRMTQLLINEKQLSGSLDASGFKYLEILHCYTNRITNLNITKNTELKYLYCYTNLITNLDLTNTSKLIVLSCSNNQIARLEPTNSSKLSSLHCRYNQITNLELTNNTGLISLDCGVNQITSLNVTKNTELTNLSCEYNQITSLDITNNSKLVELDCSSNQITSLDVTKNTKLTNLYCQGNRLKFSTLPILNIPYYGYSPQATINDTVASYKPIDLSAEYSVNEHLTNYTWYDNNMNPIVLTHKGGGIFEANADHENKTLTCKMTNEFFSFLTLEYKVFITKGSEVSITPEKAEPTIFDAEIYDTSGRLLKQATNVTEVPVQDLKAGTYIVVKTTDKGKSTEKIIKK